MQELNKALVNFNFVGLNYLLLLKVAIVFGTFLYLFFALVTVRQVQLLGKTLKTPVSPLLFAASLVNLFFALSIFCFSIILL